MEWSNEMVLEFIRNYEAEPVIWNPKNENHKKKHLVADGWRRLKNNLSFDNSTTIEELKKKKDSLMAYYRIHNYKMRNAQKSGTGTEESYKTSWFAFAAMNRFLGPIYEGSATVHTEEATEKTDITSESSTSTQRNPTVDSGQINTRKRPQVTPDQHAKKQRDESIIRERDVDKSTSDHECDLYAQLLAGKLKKIDEERRIILMHNIDNLVFREIMSARGRERAASVSPFGQSNHDIDCERDDTSESTDCLDKKPNVQSGFR